ADRRTHRDGLPICYCYAVEVRVGSAPARLGVGDSHVVAARPAAEVYVRHAAERGRDRHSLRGRRVGIAVAVAIDREVNRTPAACGRMRAFGIPLRDDDM